jgi:predicted DNA-binding protein (UPF0251 family)
LPDPSPEFVTVSQAALRLGVSVRTAQRYATRLPTSDRQVSDTEPLRVRLVALAGLIETAKNRVNGATVGPDSTADSRTSDRQETVGQSDRGDSRVETELRARLADKEQENIRLWDALQREQETSRRAMDAQNALAAELAEARKQASVLIAATAGAFKAPAQIEQVQPIPGGVTEGEPMQTDELKSEPKTASKRWQFWRWLNNEK